MNPSETQRSVDTAAPPGGLQALAVLDSAGALALMDHSTALYLDIARAFLQELDSVLAPLEGWLRHTPTEQSLRALHSFKGLSLTVGATRLAEVCRLCEAAGKAWMAAGQRADPAAQQALCQRLEHCLAETRLALLALLGAPPAAPGGRGSTPDF